MRYFTRLHGKMDAKIQTSMAFVLTAKNKGIFTNKWSIQYNTYYLSY